MSKFSKLKKLVSSSNNAKKTIKHTPVESDAFHKALSNARGSDKRVSDYTHLYDPEEYSQMKTFLAPDGKSGFAVKPDGDIVSAFNTERGGGRLDDIMKTALEHGGTKLDAFDKLPTETKGLPDLYSKYGFKPIKREANWTPGGPDVVFMEHPSAKLLKEIDTPEKAVALKGKERQAYLEALEATYGNQAKRAKDMGFGDRTWYHGTTVPIDEFKNEALGVSTGAQSAKKGFFFAQDPSTASDYADLARDRGVTRVGDEITTQFRTDAQTVYDTHNELYNLAKDKQFDININKESLQREFERQKNLEKILSNAKKNNEIERIPDLEQRLQKSQEFIKKKTSDIYKLEKEIKDLDDKVGSVGQNVLPVRLKGNPETIHVKDYKGQGYRDTTYSDELDKMNESGKDAALFRNTYDPADPNNRIKQDIAVVTKPEQVRSVNAAFDPRFKDSGLIMSAKNDKDIANATMGPILKEGISKGLHKLGAPQRYLFDKVAESLGVSGNEEDSEESARNIIQNLADRAGLPEDSELVNAGKALGVAGMEVFGDPTNVIPGKQFQKLNKLFRGK